MAKNGNIIIIKLNGTAIAGTKSNEISTNCDTIEVSSPGQGQWRNFIASRKDWSINASYLLAAVSNVEACLNVGTAYTLTICENTSGGGTKLTGTAILTQCKITATRGNILNGSFTFKGSGKLDVPST